MGRRDLSPAGKRARAGKTGPRTAAADAAARARLLIELTRAALHAREVPELAATLSGLFTTSGQDSQASLAFVDDPSRAQRQESSPPPGDDHLAFPVVIGGRTAAQLHLVTAGGRIADEVEREELQAVAIDVAFAIARLREDAHRRAIAASERRLRETFEHAGLGITRIDMDGVFLEVNQKFCEMLGYAREELVGRATKDVTVEGDYGPGAAFREQARAGRATVSIADKRYLRKDGTHMWARRTMSPAFDEDGRVKDVISIVEDITERRNALETVATERTTLRTIVDAVPHYIYVKDREGRVTLANQAWLDARGLTIEQVRGKTARDIFPEALAAQMEAQEQPVIAQGKALIDLEQHIVFTKPDGSQHDRWSLTTKVPLRDSTGNIVGVVGISREITGVKRAERERAMEHAVARVLSESRSVKETMPRLIRTICEAMGWVYGSRWVWDRRVANLVRAEWWADFDLEFDPADRHYWLELGPRQTGGLLRRAWMDERSTWLADIANVESFLRKPSALKLGLRSAYAFPIIADDERLGVMEFFGRDVREPDEAMLQVTAAIASQIGQFIRRKQAEDSLQESEQQLRAMFDNAEVGIAVSGLDLRYLRVNEKYCEIVGYTREELLGMAVTDVNLHEHVAPLLAYRERLLASQEVAQTREKQLVRKDGSLVWVSMANSLVRSSDGSPRYFIAMIQDVSESKRAAAALKESEEQFRQLAHYDMLTGLPNRALFYDRLANAVARGKRNQWTLAVLFIDVDRFKHVNDTFGHAAGDLLLKQVSQRLSGCVRNEDTVGRLSGDEFAIVLSRLTAPEDAATVATKIVDELNRPFELEGAEIFVTASIGITVFPTDSTEQETLIRNADVAMYRAKDRGRNNFQFYTPEMNRRTREMLSMEGDLRRALERDELVLHYQPKVSLATGGITGVEALLRWLHPDRGLVPPADFMPLLEETGLIVRTGDWVLHAVCEQIHAWERAGIPPVPVAINLSARQFLSPELAQNIGRVLAQHQVRPELVEVEITESAIMTNTEEAIRTLEHLEAMGVHTAVDDFGTGYSSLGYLKRFPLRALKVDRSFVRDITTDPDDATITRAVISMAHSLELKVIAEGVETEAQLAFLAQAGCDEVQGYLFSRPVPGDECGETILDSRRIAVLLEAIKSRAS